MEFKKIDSNNATKEELIAVLKENAQINKSMKDQIEKMKKDTVPSTVVVKEVPEVVLVCPKGKEKKADSSFLRELDQYVLKFKALGWNNALECMDSILPARSDYNYKSIVCRLMLEVSKEIKDINEIIAGEGDTLTSDDLEVCKEEVTTLNGFMSKLQERLTDEEVLEVSDIQENRLVFMTTNSGNFSMENDLKSIPQENYEEFLTLFKSIKDGSFKNSHGLEQSAKLRGLFVVFDHQSRIAYQKLSDDIYLIVSMYIKKDTREKSSLTALEKRYANCKSQLDKIKSNILNDEFMKLHKDYELELFELLGDTKEDSKGAYIYE